MLRVVETCEAEGCGYAPVAVCVGRCRRVLCGRHFVDWKRLYYRSEYGVPISQKLTSDERLALEDGGTKVAEGTRVEHAILEWVNANGSPECVECLGARIEGLASFLDASRAKVVEAAEGRKRREAEAPGRLTALAEQLSQEGRMDVWIRTSEGQTLLAACIHTETSYPPAEHKGHWSFDKTGFYLTQDGRLFSGGVKPDWRGRLKVGPCWDPTRDASRLTDLLYQAGL